MSYFLIEERPLTLLPSLVRLLGFEKAAVIQQLYWLQNQPRTGREIDGEKWVWGAYQDLCDEFFPFWEAQALKRHILALEKMGLLRSCQPNVKAWDRRKHYRVDRKAITAAYKSEPSKVSPEAPSEGYAEARSEVSPEAPSSGMSEAPSYKEQRCLSEMSTEMSTENTAPLKNSGLSISEPEAQTIPAVKTTTFGADWYMATYNELRPPTWKGCEIINPHRAKKLKAFRAEYKERAPDIFKAALIFAQRDPWWSSKNLNFDTLFTKNHITQFAEGAMTALQTGVDPAQSEYDRKRKKIMEALA